ncbi:MAG TPA: hypothetical protein P5244_07245 [Syntrophales bacterium]|jgi:hypothetical protein|nr:hypothetical protein [Syntrophales bacterium]
MNPENWTEIFKSLVFWGPGCVIAGVIIWALYRLANTFIEKFVTGLMSIGTDFISAQKEQAASLAKMAQGTEGLRDSITNFVNRDNQEHREIIILLKYTRDQINQLTGSLDTLAAFIKEQKKS